VEIILQNDDAMQHNLVVVTPGALEEIGLAAEKMLPEPDANSRLYVPQSPKVLQATRLLDPGQQARLSFTAPDEPGDYPYLCTYPGHWRRMVGTLAVAKDVEAYLASHAAEAEPKNGDELFGMIIKEDSDTLTLQTGPSDALIRTLKKSDIKERQPQSSSTMPIGLLNSLSKDQILDLLAFLESGGNAPVHAHRH